jgi:hypothetical protein
MASNADQYATPVCRFEMIGIEAKPLAEAMLQNDALTGRCLTVWAQRSGTDQLWPIFFYDPSRADDAGMGFWGAWFS